MNDAACKIVITKQQYFYDANGSVLLSVYAGLTLATTLLCTLLMIYRILAVARVTDGGGNGSRAYRHVIEVFVESSALYAVSLIVYVACIARGNVGLTYLDPIAGFTRVCQPVIFPRLKMLKTLYAGHCSDAAFGARRGRPCSAGRFLERERDDFAVTLWAG